MIDRRRKLWLGLIGVFLVFAVGLFQLQRAKAYAQSLNCASSICSICLGGRLYAHDHGGFFPTNFISFRDELMTPMILRCAGDHSRLRAKNWKEFTDANSSYEILSNQLHENDTNTVFVRCQVHGHVGYSDVTVFDGVRRRGKFP